MKHLVIGGVRSGKSAFAQQLVQEYSRDKDGAEKEVIYLATSKALDEGMAARIEKHQQNRPSEWHLIEEEKELAAILQNPSHQASVILIECMTLWLTNLMCMEDSQRADKFKADFLQALTTTTANVVLVTSEVGCGVMPMNKMARDFADQIGELNQALATLSDKATLVSAGLPLTLK